MRVCCPPWAPDPCSMVPDPPVLGPRATWAGDVDAIALSRHRLYELIRSGELSTVKIGNLRRVPVRSMVAYVDGLLLQVGRDDDHAA